MATSGVYVSPGKQPSSGVVPNWPNHASTFKGT
jgi:hypothetical protein